MRGGKLPRLLAVAVCCVCASPQPSLNLEGRSEKRLRSTTSVFLLCVRENPRRLSKLLARKRRPGNHGNGRSPHAEGGSEPAR